MKKFISVIFTVALFGSMALSCKQKVQTMATEADSLSYVIGLSVGQSLIKFDSTLNIDMVCEAIRDVYNSTEKISFEEGRDYYLGQQTYFIHEKAERYQEQFLEDLRKSNRDFVRLRNGVTYKIVKLGDQNNQSLVSRDTISIALSIFDQSGNVIRRTPLSQHIVTCLRVFVRSSELPETEVVPTFGSLQSRPMAQRVTRSWVSSQISCSTIR